MAGIPSYVLIRAKDLLSKFMDGKKNGKLDVKKDMIDVNQVELFNIKDGK